jgi:hypothetical protein
MGLKEKYMGKKSTVSALDAQQDNTLGSLVVNNRIEVCCPSHYHTSHHPSFRKHLQLRFGILLIIPPLWLHSLSVAYSASLESHRDQLSQHQQYPRQLKCISHKF